MSSQPRERLSLQWVADKLQEKRTTDEDPVARTVWTDACDETGRPRLGQFPGEARRRLNGALEKDLVEAGLPVREAMLACPGKSPSAALEQAC
jgi:hypothetical protein